MGFGDALRSAFGKYADFSGRARRSEYWFFQLFVFLAVLIAGVLDAAAGSEVFTALVLLGLVLPELAVTVRRLHDTGHAGWWILLGLIPFGGFALLVLACTDGQPSANRFGPSPKYAAAAAWAPPVAPAPGRWQPPPPPPPWS